MKPIIIYMLSLITCFQINSPAKGQDVLNIMDVFEHSGYMGCINNIIADRKYNSESSKYNKIKISTSVCGPQLWSGVFFQYPDTNWCQTKGLNLSGKRYKKMSFSIKGEIGGEVVQYKIGNDKCDSFTSFKKTIELKPTWEKIEIDLKNADLSNVVSPFGWFVDFRRTQSTEVTFYIEDLIFE